MKPITSANIQNLVKDDSGLRLIRSGSAIFVIPFLFNTFHVNNVSVMSFNAFEMQLCEYMERQIDDEEVLYQDLDDIDNLDESQFFFEDQRKRARKYIESWYSEKKGYLRHYRNENKEEVLELSAGVNRLFTYIDKMFNSDLIGTESSFNAILSEMRFLHENMDADPVKRVASLEQKIEELKSEINTIVATGKAKSFTPAQIYEYLGSIEHRAKELIGDFGQVEQNFREILRDVTKKEADASATKGSIFGYSLDLESKLRLSPQGQSFNAFWTYLLNSGTFRNDDMAVLSKDILKKAEEQGVIWDSSYLLQLRSTMFGAGKKVVDKNDLLTKRMSRVLLRNEKYSQEHQYASSLIDEIKRRAIQLSDDETVSGSFEMELDFAPDLNFPLERSLILENSKGEMNPISFEENSSANPDDLVALCSQFFVDREKITSQMEVFGKRLGRNFSLSEYVAAFPLEKGLSEIIVCMKIAEETVGCSVSTDEKEKVYYTWQGKEYIVELPKMEFMYE